MSRRRKVLPRFWMIILGGFVIAYGFAYAAQGKVLAAGEKTIAQLEEQKAQLEDQSVELQRKIKFASTDEFVERAARESLDLVKEGETRYVSSGD